MMKMNRLPAPDWLILNWEKWGIEFENAVKKTDWRNKFKPKQEKYDELVDILLRSTFQHCSYCDNFKMGGNVKPTIDHFKPQSKFKKLTYKWENLFIACHYCQERNNKYEDLLLKPDVENYHFKKYFEYDNKSGEIKANRNANSSNQKRANYTIETLKLNRDKKYKNTIQDVRIERKEAYRKYKSEALNGNLNNLPFRFMFV